MRLAAAAAAGGGGGRGESPGPGAPTAPFQAFFRRSDDKQSVTEETEGRTGFPLFPGGGRTSRLGHARRGRERLAPPGEVRFHDAFKRRRHQSSVFHLQS